MLGAGAEAPLARWESRNLMAHGQARFEDSSPTWLAIAEGRPGQETTVVYLRERLGGREWTEVARVPGRMLQISSWGSELVALLKPASGAPWQWAIVSSRRSLGAALPGKSREEMLALAGDRRSLWALGLRVPGNAATNATAPATRPAGPVLYVLKGDQWIEQPGEWPADLPIGPQTRLSMAIVGKGEEGRPTVAVTGPDGLVHMIHHAGGKWSRLESWVVEAGYFKLLNVDARPALWCQGTQVAEAAGQLLKQGGVTTALSLAGPSPRSGDVDLTMDGDMLGLFFQRFTPRGEVQRFEQVYQVADVKPAGAVTEIRFRRQEQDRFQQWITVSVMAVLSILILNVMLRRRATERDDSEDEE